MILKATRDICGNELGLIEHNCQLLKFDVVTKSITSALNLSRTIKDLSVDDKPFDYIYLCTHGNIDGFQVDLGGRKLFIRWSRFSQLICENDILKEDTILLLACCKGGFFQVATDILATCTMINLVCGVKWNVAPWDLTTGFVVFIHNIENKNAEPSYAAQKASLATDYTFLCYDRDEVKINPQYQYRKRKLFKELNWIDDDDVIIVKDKTVLKC